MISFTVLGIPVPQGSKKGFFNKGLNRVQLVESNDKTQPWRDSVTAAAAQAYPIEHFPVIQTPVRVVCSFAFPYRSADLKKDGSPKRPGYAPKSSKPDLDKLVRAVLDAVTAAGVWVDDSQVAQVYAEKFYSSRPRAEIQIKEIGVDHDQRD
jgi:Holliday junction resolvase RusA-like endonuclease